MSSGELAALVALIGGLLLILLWVWRLRRRGTGVVACLLVLIVAVPAYLLFYAFMVLSLGGGVHH